MKEYTITLKDIELAAVLAAIKTIYPALSKGDSKSVEALTSAYSVIVTQTKEQINV